MYINDIAERGALARGWTYESGYKQGYDAGRFGQGDTNFFPKFTSAWWGWKEGNKDGKKSR